ncbi:hypothetical protein H5410_017503, partial [Solanum commersonii]
MGEKRHRFRITLLNLLLKERQTKSKIFVDRKETTLIYVPIKNETSFIAKVVYNVEDIKRVIAEFIIIDEQPFKVVEGEGLKKLMVKALPNFELPSRLTVIENTTGTDVKMIIDSLPVVSIPQKKGKNTLYLRTTPKEQTRTTPIDFIPTDGKRRAKCNYCVKHFAAETKTNETSVLWSHLNDKCLKSPFRFVDRKQTTLKSVPIKVGGQENRTSYIAKVVYNVEDIRRAIAEFIIIDEQPFKVVEGEGFKQLMAKALPNFELPSR